MCLTLRTGFYLEKKMMLSEVVNYRLLQPGKHIFFTFLHFLLLSKDIVWQFFRQFPQVMHDLLTSNGEINPTHYNVLPVIDSQRVVSVYKPPMVGIHPA